MSERGLDEALEQGMRIERLGLELRMELDGEEPRVVGQLDDLRQIPLDVVPREHEAVPLDGLPIAVVHLVAVAMALDDAIHPIRAMGERLGNELAGVRAEPHRSAHPVE